MDEKQKEELKQKAKETGREAVKMLGQFSRWSLKKGKEGVKQYKEGVKQYQEWSEEQAEKKRRIAERNAERNKQAAITREKMVEKRRIKDEKKAKQQAILDEKNRIEEQKLAVIRRNQRHENLCEILQDPLEVLETDLAIFFVNQSDNIISSTFLRFAQKGLEPKLSDNVFDSKAEMEKVLNKGAFHIVRRTVVDLNEKEIGVLKLMSFFNKVQLISDRDYAYMELCISYNEGNSSFYAKDTAIECTDETYSALMEFIPCWIKSKVRPPAPVINESIALIGRARKEVDDPDLTAIIEKELKGAEGWMKASAI